MLFLMFRSASHPFKKASICKKIITFMLKSIIVTK